MKTHSFDHPTVVSPEEWLVARRELLRQEKEYTKLGDQLSQRRRQLPWTKVEKPYRFDSPAGPVSLADLFEGRRQPKGRDQDGLEYEMGWIRYHDRYAQSADVVATS